MKWAPDQQPCRGKGQEPVEIKSRVELFDPPRHLNQFGGYVGVITFDHHYILEPVDGGTRSSSARTILDSMFISGMPNG